MAKNVTSTPSGVSPESSFRQIAERLADAIMIIDRPAQRITYTSAVFEEIHGRTASELADGGADWRQWLHPQDRGRVEQAYRNYLRGDPFEEEYRVLRPDGRLRRVHARAFPMEDGGAKQRDIVLLHDVTLERQLEEDLRQAQKMEVVGALASGLAHDFNNVLQAILGCINVARREGTRPEDAQRYLDRAAEAARRGGELAGRLMTFTHKRDIEVSPIEIDPVVEGVGELLRRLVTEEITVTIETAARDTTVVADPVQIEQILMNLTANARDAMPDGGLVSIRTDTVVAGASMQGHGLTEGTRYVRLIVADDGEGMDDATQKRIFEPFFTTKKVGEGTGLGLSTVFAVTHQLGGRVDVRSTKGEGTTFTIYLPCRDHAGAVTSASTPRCRALRGTVLLVEDEPVVRLAVRAHLESLGLRVLDAGGPEDALRLAEEQTMLDVLISDISLFGMRGPELAAEVAKHHQNVKVLFISATPEAAVGHDWERAAAPVLSKPFHEHELADALEKLLDAN